MVEAISSDDADELFGEFKEELPDDSMISKLGTLADEMLRVEGYIANVSALLKNLTDQHTMLCRVTIPRLMIDEINMESFTLVGGAKMTIKHNVKTNISVARKTEAYKWMRDHGFGALIKIPKPIESIHAGTLNAWAKEQLDLGNEVPEKLLGLHEYDEAKIKVPKAKKPRAKKK